MATISGNEHLPIQWQ